MTETKQISGTMKADLAGKIEELAKKEGRSFSKMLEIVAERGYNDRTRPRKGAKSE